MTLRRFGWSLLDQQEADVHARERLEHAISRWKLDPKTARRDRKKPYEANREIPIREEVIALTEEYALTRNSYGSLCLNAANVMIVDIDFSEPNDQIGCLLASVPAVATVVLIARQQWMLATVCACIAVVGIILVSLGSRRFKDRDQTRKLREIEDFANLNRDWGFGYIVRRLDIG